MFFIIILSKKKYKKIMIFLQETKYPYFQELFQKKISIPTNLSRNNKTYKYKKLKKAINLYLIQSLNYFIITQNSFLMNLINYFKIQII